MDDDQDIDSKATSPSGVDGDELDMDDASAGDGEEEDEDGDPLSPNAEQQSGSALLFDEIGSEQTELLNPGSHFQDSDVSVIALKHQHPCGKPLNIRRKPGRPRKERVTRCRKSSLGLKLKKWKSDLFMKGTSRSVLQLKDFSRDASMLEEAELPPKSPLPSPVTEEPVPSVMHSDTEQTMANIESHSEVGDGASSVCATKVEKMHAPEEPPYFPEQWPGKVCALCNLGERSQLGQGDLMRLTCPEGFTPLKTGPGDNRERSEGELTSPSAESTDGPDRESPGGSLGDKSPRAAVTVRRQKSMAKCKNPSLATYTEPVDELSVVGFMEEPDVGSIFETSGHFYVHQSCALWSSGVTRTEDLVLENVGPAVLQGSSRRCSYCSHFGATIPCLVVSCQKYLHFPCAAASGAFQDSKTVAMVCNQHLDQVPLLLSGEMTCMSCFALGDVSNLMMCTICGHHYHGSCVGLALLPGVRAGWQCPDCRVCQICRQPEEISKVMLCETCDKAYHPQCLRPIVTTIPKYGWKCKCCRVCSDCGSRTPGAGASSRWHAHYTVCDSCYQQRNKGYSCPLCRKAYRAAAYRGMVQCSLCRKFVHGTCDSEAEMQTYQHKKEANPDYEYICPNCKSLTLTGRQMLLKRKDSTDEGGLDYSFSTSQESVFMDESTESESVSSDKPGLENSDMPKAIGLGKGKPFSASKIAKKKLGLSSVSGRPKGVGKGGVGVGKGAVGYQKRQKITDFGRKRGPKSKMRGIFGVPGVGLQRPQADSSTKTEDEPGVENRLVLCSAKDKFVLTQDICVMCGAIGMDQEGCLISCAQCGQCYHPYCVNVKVTKVILQKGWRCLDCTVCEGCGQRNDEARLILCDDCDISYHIYCMDPPLDYVPHGNWKCKWCAICISCGTNDPGFNCTWQKSFTVCGPCASHTTCPSCQESYTEGDLLIQCVQCERWLHCACDQIHTEMEAERCSEEGYNCILCRPRDVPPPHLVPLASAAKPPTPTKSPEPARSMQQDFFVDGVCLSESGMRQIKSLTGEPTMNRKKRFNKKIPTKADKEAGILATIESVVAGSSLDNSSEQDGIKMEVDEMKEIKEEPMEVYKEGMIVTPRDDGRPPEPPEGFTICTTESGVMMLRRKRQRNLQKLGIGGFAARMRNTRYKDKEDEETPAGAGTTPPAGCAAEEEKPRRKPQRRKPKSKLMESYPSYLQEAFFGRDLLDITKEKGLRSSSDSEDDNDTSHVSEDKTIQLSQGIQTQKKGYKTMKVLEGRDLPPVEQPKFA